MPIQRTKLTDEISVQGEDVLHCPCCDGFYLHQNHTEIFNRGEDDQAGNHVSIIGDNVNIDRDISANPSGRRHGLIIHFDCENCSANVRMKIYQHKGNTFVGMEYDEQS